MKQNEYGFTLIEIIIVLVLLGILAATAVPKYFDLQAEAQKIAFQSTVAEAQGRINTRFGQLLMEGNSCEKAVEAVSTLEAIQDADGGVFGEHVLKIEEDFISRWGTAVQAKRNGDTDNFIDTGAKLYVAACDTSLDAYLDTTVKGLIKKLLEGGNLYNTPEEREQFLQEYPEFVTGNGVTVSLGNAGDDLQGIKNQYAKLKLFFTDISGNKAEIQFRRNADGTTTIHQLFFTPVGGNKQIIIQSWKNNGDPTPAAFQDYKKNMEAMGIDTSKFGTAFDSFGGEITIPK